MRFWLRYLLAYSYPSKVEAKASQKGTKPLTATKEKGRGGTTTKQLMDSGTEGTVKNNDKAKAVKKEAMKLAITMEEDKGREAATKQTRDSGSGESVVNEAKQDRTKTVEKDAKMFAIMKGKERAILSNIILSDKMPKAGIVAGKVYYFTMFLLLATVALGTAFIVLAMASRFFKWKVGCCCCVQG